ncbi:hypothetical protein [Streptomyces sp. NPDC001388]|uniref:hypothetical protein n=1 Tax=Streptomyces sp. NPDC001388 TaxID=3364568 RepID=UPI0036902019
MMPARGTAAMAAVCAAGVLALAGCSSGDGPEGKDGGSGGSAQGPAATAVSTTPSSPVASPSASAPPPASPSPSAPASASPTPVPVTGPDQQLVTMAVTGGFAGVRQEVVLRGDGTVRVTDKGGSEVRRTTAAQFRELRTLLGGVSKVPHRGCCAGLSKHPLGDPELADVPSFTRDTGAADMFQYTLRFDGRTVTTDRSGEEPALDRLIDALDDWLPDS